MIHSRPRRRGFSLSELLIIVAILGVLIALLLPAIQASREAARRSSCAVKTKNIAVAFHIYHDNFQRLPGSAFYRDGRNLKDKGYELKKLVVGKDGDDALSAPYAFYVGGNGVRTICCIPVNNSPPFSPHLIVSARPCCTFALPIECRSEGSHKQMVQLQFLRSYLLVAFDT